MSLEDSALGDEPANSLRRRTPLLAGWLLALTLAALVTLQGLAILPLTRQTLTVADLRPFEGVTYSASIPPPGYLAVPQPAGQLYENGRPTPFPMSPDRGAVIRLGNGRYSVEGSRLFVSATDNSDPRTNGRLYTFVRPTPVSRLLVLGAWAVALLVTVKVCLRFRRTVLRILWKPPFALPAAVLLVVVGANRAWLFFEYPIAAVHPDSASYYAAAEAIGSGAWPGFGVRPPVYPLFLKVVFSVVDRVMAAAVLQTLLSIAAAMLLVWAAYRWSPVLAVPAALAMAGFLCGNAPMEHDTAMLSESLYTTLLMLSFSGLLLAIRRRDHPRPLATASTTMALAILTRPAGTFLVVTYAVVLAWLFWSRYRSRAIAAFATPLPALLLLMCTYNWRTVGSFAVSTWGEANLAVATFTYWQPDPTYPPRVNQDIGMIQTFVAQRITDVGSDAKLLDRSWDVRELSRIFVLGFHGHALDIAMGLGERGYEATGRQWIRRIAFDSIRKRPLVYAKFVYAMLYNYFRPWPEYDFKEYIVNRVQNLFVNRSYSVRNASPLLVRTAKEFADASPPPGVVVAEFDPEKMTDARESILIAPSPGWRLYRLTYSIRRVGFETWLWRIALFAALIASAFTLVRTRGHHAASFAIFVMTVSTVGAALVVSLVEYSQPRYSYPMEWTYALSAALLPLVFRRPGSVAGGDGNGAAG